jgi:hypothetical protein
LIGFLSKWNQKDNFRHDHLHHQEGSNITPKQNHQARKGPMKKAIKQGKVQ